MQVMIGTRRQQMGLAAALKKFLTLLRIFKKQWMASMKMAG
jgi:hypothetical protein